MAEKKGLEKRIIDWEGVEAAYVAGMESLRAIGERFGVSDAGIIKRARKYGWKRASPKTVGKLISAFADAKEEGLDVVSAVSKSKCLLTEIDRLAELKAKLNRNAHMIADAIPPMLNQATSMQEVQQAAKAHRDLQEAHFGKAAPEVQVNTQVNQQVNIAEMVKGFRVVDDVD